MIDTRKYKVNDNLFDIIDSDEKAYFLGFIFADGCVHKEGNCITIDLNFKDKDILYKFSKLLKVDGIVTERRFKNRNPSTVLKFHSKKIKEKLIYWGCGPNKSSTIKLSENLINDLPKKFISSFLRGLYDGDGGITKFTTKNGTIRYRIYITGGSFDFLNELNRIYHLDMKISTINNSKTVNLSFMSNFGAHLFLDYIYQNITPNKFLLERKYNKYLEFKETTLKNLSHSYLFRLEKIKENIDLIKKLRNKNVSVTKMAKIFEYDRHIMSNILKELNL